MGQLRSECRIVSSAIKVIRDENTKEGIEDKIRKAELVLLAAKAKEKKILLDLLNRENNVLA